MVKKKKQIYHRQKQNQQNLRAVLFLDLTKTFETVELTQRNKMSFATSSVSYFRKNFSISYVYILCEYSYLLL